MARDVGDLLWQANYKSMSYEQLLAVQLPIGLTLQERADRLAFIAFEIRLKAPAKGGPTEGDPDRPYCKPDQSCCDFCCGN